MRPPRKGERGRRQRQTGGGRAKSSGTPPRRSEGDGHRPLPRRAPSGDARHSSVSSADNSSDAVVRAAERSAQSRPVRQLLAGLGTPAPAAFTPDPFQLEAFAALEHEDVLVTAPTGSGKTWIAREEIRRLLAAGKRAWYTSPLKALTNSKYQEFAEAFGADNVGILTGDRKEKSDAPLVIGTTEVYRNQLFDALREGRELRADLVVMDEAHYLADEERGHVWEEAIILTPPRVRLLLLSATIGNADEFARWIEAVRGVRCGVVARPGARPVPLRAGFLYPEGELAPLLSESGRFNTEIAQYLERARAPRHHDAGRGSVNDNRRAARLGKMNVPEMPPASLLAALGVYDLLPAIVFLPTRRRCDEAAAEAALGLRQRGGVEQDERREQRGEVLRLFIEAHPEVRKHKHAELIVRGGVASHHAGHLPAWKLLIEELMSAGLLDAIFATATVAAGVDFPARTVVITNIDARRADGWRVLSASQVQQMTGRAGRRGRDHVGFVIAAPGTHQDPQRLSQLLSAPPDPLESQFRATYTTLLNLLDAYGDFAHVREIAARSFAHRDTVERLARLEQERQMIEQRIAHKLNAGNDEGGSVAAARGLERLASARSRLLGGAPQTRTESLQRWLDQEVLPGRVVGVGRSGKRLVFVTERRGATLAGVREDGRRASLALERIGRIYSEVYPLTEDALEASFADVRGGRALLVAEPRLREARAQTDEAVNIINDLLDQLSPSRKEAADGDGDGEHPGGGAESLWSVRADAEELERLARRLEAVREEVWRPFQRRARVLDHFGYLDFAAERVTERGRWLADLRLDRPLLVGEAIERQLFARLEPAHAAGLMAAMVADADRAYGELPLADALVTTLGKFERIAHEVAGIEWSEGLDAAEEINYSAAAATARWAAGAKWDDLVRLTRAEEGDLFRLLSRTGESLLQIGNLDDAHPDAARVAAAAAAAILREPVRADEI